MVEPQQEVERRKRDPTACLSSLILELTGVPGALNSSLQKEESYAPGKGQDSRQHLPMNLFQDLVSSSQPESERGCEVETCPVKDSLLTGSPLPYPFLTFSWPRPEGGKERKGNPIAFLGLIDGDPRMIEDKTAIFFHLVYGLLLLSLLFWSCSFSYSLLGTTPKVRRRQEEESPAQGLYSWVLTVNHLTFPSTLLFGRLVRRLESSSWRCYILRIWKINNERINNRFLKSYGYLSF